MAEVPDLLQEYTVKPEVYNFGILLAPVGASGQPVKEAVADLWQHHRK